MRTRALALAMAVAFVATPAQALLVEMTEAEIELAIAHGKTTFEKYRKDGRPIDDLDPEYVVDLGENAGRALLFTEFGSLALETRRYLAIGRPFRPADVTAVLAPLRGRIEFFVVAVGQSRDFLENYKVSLVDQRARHAPAGWNISRGVPKPGATGRFLASGRYTFAARDLARTAPATLVLEGPEGQALKFDFDLSRLR
jgi:hypothetical protein